MEMRRGRIESLLYSSFPDNHGSLMTRMNMGRSDFCGGDAQEGTTKCAKVTKEMPGARASCPYLKNNRRIALPETGNGANTWVRKGGVYDRPPK